MTRTQLTAPILVLALLAVAPTAALASEAEETMPPNVRLSIQLGRAGRGAPPPSAYSMVCPGDGSSTEIMKGQRVPIPVTTFNTAQTVGGNVVPVTSYQYQDIGFRAVAWVTILSDGRIHLRGQIEHSTASESPHQEAGRPLPQFSVVEHQLNVVLEGGTTLTTTSYGADGAKPLEMTLRADILD